MLAWLIGQIEGGWLPDPLVRAGIRHLLAARMRQSGADDCERALALEQAFIAQMDAAALALLPEKANEQHYELPAEFFQTVLGPRYKYSSCYWGKLGEQAPGHGRGAHAPDRAMTAGAQAAGMGMSDQSDPRTASVNTLVEAEIAALELTAQRARIGPGMRVLELGCGWGSFCLWAAERYPDSEFVGVSNSHSQREAILATAHVRGIANLRIITADINDFATNERFDRIVSIEMLEHTRNWRSVFSRIAGWLRPDGQFFMHVFCHRAVPYAFEDRDASDWMSRYFFSGGMMPSDDLPLYFQDDLQLIGRWRWNGQHYERTLNAWLARMDSARDTLRPVFDRVYGAQGALWWQRWRLFFMACAELFGYRGGEQWWVGHYLFSRRAARVDPVGSATAVASMAPPASL